MKLGQKAMEALRAEITGVLKENDDLVVAGSIALSGTALVAVREKAVLQQYFSEGFLWDAKRGPSLYSAFGTEEKPESSSVWKRAADQGAHALYALGPGGILAGLWKMAEASETGLYADLRKVPVRQESIEICERFDLNPYKLLSEGCLLIGIPKGDALVQFCSERGIPAAVIGRAVKGNDRLLYSGANARYLERPSKDEITRFSWGQEWAGCGRLPGKKEETEEC